MIVVDANVAAKWYVPEPGSTEAKSILRQQVKRIAPSIVRYEVLGTITRTVKESRAKPAESTAWCRLWQSHLEDNIIELADLGGLLDDAIATSIQTKHHLYDCFYLVLCRATNATLVTFDERLAKAAKRLGISFELLVEPAVENSV